MLAAQIDARIQLRRRGFDVMQPQAPRDRHQVDLHLQSRHEFTDTVSRTGGKREHRQRVPILRTIGREAIRIEALRSLPEIGVALDEVGRNIDFRSRRNEIVAEPVVLARPARYQPDRRIQPQRLVDDLARVGKLRQLGKAGKRACAQPAQFARQPRLGIRVL
jgi:hypothetical protein